jgi:Family of unknown function (DUF5399)
MELGHSDLKNLRPKSLPCIKILNLRCVMGDTIDRLDISVYNLYAIRTRMIEQTVERYQLGQAGTVPPQTLIIDFYPKMNQLDILLGITAMFTPWAYFYPPKNFSYQRRSPFSFYRAAPSLGSFKDQEMLEEKLALVECSTPEESEEKAAITGCLKQVDKVNAWLSFIIGRIGQFLQG